MLLAYEVTRDLPLSNKEIETPLCKMQAPMLEGEDVVLISILRAGNGILTGMLNIYHQLVLGISACIAIRRRMFRSSIILKSPKTRPIAM